MFLFFMENKKANLKLKQFTPPPPPPKNPLTKFLIISNLFLIFSIILGIITFSGGWHIPEEILSGTFKGNYNFSKTSQVKFLQEETQETIGWNYNFSNARILIEDSSYGNVLGIDSNQIVSKELLNLFSNKSIRFVVGNRSSSNVELDIKIEDDGYLVQNNIYEKYYTGNVLNDGNFYNILNVSTISQGADDIYYYDLFLSYHGDSYVCSSQYKIFSGYGSNTAFIQEIFQKNHIYDDSRACLARAVEINSYNSKIEIGLGEDNSINSIAKLKYILKEVRVKP